MELTHFNEHGHGQMVDVSQKQITQRIAVAHARIRMNQETYQAIHDKAIKKGDVFAIAQVAGIQAVKKTSELIPMAHPLLLTKINITYESQLETLAIEIYCTVGCEGKTGVEMEALTGASVCALTIYDMAKAMDPGMVIDEIYLVEKEGGKSGHYKANQK